MRKEGHYVNERSGRPVCYECGREGHRRSECPKLKGAQGRNEAANKPKGRAFTMTTVAAKETPDMVSGTFLVDNVPATVLFDSGSSRSFVSVNFCASLDKVPSKLDTIFEVETAVGRSVVISKVFKGCHIDLDGHKVPIKLYPMLLGEFDIILGMDWLAKNDAQIVCNRKMIQMQAPDGSRIIVYGDRSNSAVKIISMMKAQKCMHKGCRAYLAYVVDTAAKPKELKDVPVVCQFPDVFPDDLPGMPPKREVEFRIDLVPRAKTVAKAPYRLAPSEMKELMSQLQDLLDKRFIRPRISPWGAPILFVKKKDGSMRMCIDYREKKSLFGAQVSRQPLKN